MNHLAGKFYVDTNVPYAFNVGEAEAIASSSARNIFNSDPPLIASVSNFSNASSTAVGLYVVNERCPRGLAL